MPKADAAPVLIVNQAEWRITGMSRSGNHAIIGWLLQQVTGDWCFLNCVEGKTNPYLTARPMHDGMPYSTNIRNFDLAAEQTGLWQHKDLLLFSLEDNFLGNVHHHSFEANHDGWLGPSMLQRDVLVLRDPYNLFASRLRDESAVVSAEIAARIWKQHAKEALGRTRRLTADRLVVDYDRWFMQRDYRRWIAREMGLQFDDAGFSRVPTCNGGSSFDGLRFDGQAQRMRVLERWRHCIDDPQYRVLFDDEMHELARLLYGHHDFLELPFDF